MIQQRKHRVWWYFQAMPIQKLHLYIQKNRRHISLDLSKHFDIHWFLGKLNKQHQYRKHQWAFIHSSPWNIHCCAGSERAVICSSLQPQLPPFSRGHWWSTDNTGGQRHGWRAMPYVRETSGKRSVGTDTVLTVVEAGKRQAGRWNCWVNRSEI